MVRSRRPGRRRGRPDRHATGPAAAGPVDAGPVRFVADPGSVTAWTVMVDGVPSSHVDLADPTRLDFEYMRWMGDVLDLLTEPASPLRVAHLGGAGCTLPRYVEATRPGSRQVVFEVDPAVVEAVRPALGLRSGPRMRLRVADGRAGLAALPSISCDVVIRDAFAGTRVPPHLRTTGFLTEVARVLAPGGVYLANVPGNPPLTGARAEAATALARFAEVALVAEPAQLKGGRRHGNVVLVGSEGDLPVAALARRLAGGAVRARLMTTEEVRRFASGHHPEQDPDPGA